MSLPAALVRLPYAPVSAGRGPARAGTAASTMTTTITTGTTGPGRSVVRS